NSRSLYPEESQKFVSFLLEKSEFIAVSAFAIPGNSSRILEQSKNDPYYAKAFDMYESGEMVGDLYRRANTGRFNTIVHQEIKLMFQGNKTSKECAESLQQNWQNISGMSSSYQ
ncbi:MAG: hypothetical protein LBH07_02675, partial [Treponema sp.]|nr:hypothetical protein [Treponema sp.]